jgi:hypothetical protein
MALCLWVIHILPGISATFFSLLVGAQIDYISNEQAKILAFIAAVLIALMTSFSLGGKSNSTGATWRRPHAAIIRFNEGFLKGSSL